MSDGHLRIRRAEPGDIELVAALLEEASSGLSTKGIRQWPKRFDHAVPSPALDEVRSAMGTVY
ncbi:hypothetical protein GCM10027262_05250 [Nocardia tengchongensis]